MQRDLAFDASQLTWVINAYVLTYGGFLILAGRCADLYGRKRAFLLGATVFTLSSLACGLAPSLGILLISRATQGLGAAFMSSAALAVITATFTDQINRRKALQAWGAVGSIAATVGLVAGGPLIDNTSWRSVFFINLPIGIAMVWHASKSLPPDKSTDERRTIDIGGALTITGTLVCIVYLTASLEPGEKNISWIAAAGGATILFTLFLRIEARHPKPLVSLKLFRNKILTVANAAMFLAAGASVSIVYIWSLYMQSLLGYSAAATGWAFLPSTVTGVAASLCTGKLLRNFGSRTVIASGSLLIAIGAAIIPVTGAHMGYFASVFPSMIIASFGIVCARIAVTVQATTRVKEADSGLAAGVLNTSQQTGAAFFLALLFAMAIWFERPIEETVGLISGGYDIISWGAVSLAVMTTTLAIAFMSRSPPNLHSRH